MFRRLRYKIAAYFAALMIVVMALVLLVVNILVGRNADSVIELRFNEARLLFQQQLSNDARYLTGMGLVVSRAPRLLAAVGTGDHATVLDAAEALRNQVKSELITVIDRGGRVMAQVHDPQHWGEDVTGEPLISSALNGRSQAGLIVEEGEIYQVVAVPLVSGGEEISGALRLGFRINDQFASTMKNLTGTDITFFTGSKMLASSLDSTARQELERILGGLPEGRKDVFSKAEAFDIKIGRERFRCAVVDLPIRGSMYLIQRSIDREKAFHVQLQMLLLLVGLVSLIIATLVSVFLARGIARPVSQLAELSSKVAGGNLEVHFESLARDEIGELARSFNFMTDRLRKYLAELDRHRRNLERMVEERTAELAAANQQLEQRNLRLSELSELSLASFEDQIALFEAITETARKLLGADIAVLGRMIPDQCEIFTVSGAERTRISDPSAFGFLARYYSLEPEKDILIKEIDESVGKPGSGKRKRETFKSYVRVNIQINERKFASLCLLSRSRAAFNAQDLEVLGILRRILSAEVERKEWERQILAYAAEVEKANKAKSEFLANMSHELRTPLNAIIGFSELMNMGSPGELNEKQKRYVNNIFTSGKHLLTLINEILDLSKVEAGVLDLTPEKFIIADALNNTESLIRGYAAKKKVEIVFTVAPDLTTITVDQTRFKQILFNLLSNAVKFTPEGGNIELKASLLEDVGSLEQTARLSPGGYLLISVADSGIGIAPEDHNLVWGEFKQVDSSYARIQEGTGLGLALTKRLVEMQDGAVWFESAPGAGTTFYFVLPLGTVQAAKTPAEHQAAGRKES